MISLSALITKYTFNIMSNLNGNLGNNNNGGNVAGGGGGGGGGNQNLAAEGSIERGR